MTHWPTRRTDRRPSPLTVGLWGRRRRLPTLGAALVVALGILATAETHAANGRGFFLGNRAALTGGAGAALLSDGSSLWYNPAGLGGNTRDQVDLSASAFVLRLRDYPEIVETTLASGEVRREGLSGVELLSVPAALAYTRELDDAGTSLAFGLFVPMQDRFDLKRNLSASEAGVEHKQRLSFRGDEARYVGAIGVGWRASSALRLGLSLLTHVDMGTLDTAVAFDLAPTDKANPARVVSTTTNSGDITRLGVQVALGAQLDLGPDWTLGAVLRTPVVQLWRSLEVGSLSTLGAIDQAGTPTVDLTFDGVDEAGFDVRLSQPPMLTLAVGWRIGAGAAMSAEVDLETGLEDKEESIDNAMSWNARFGGWFAVGPVTTLGFGLFTDRSAEPTPREFGDQRVDFWGVSLGLERRTVIATDKTDDPEGLVLVSTIAVRYAIGFGQAGGAVIDLFSGGPERELTVDVTHHELGLHIGSGLLF